MNSDATSSECLKSNMSDRPTIFEQEWWYEASTGGNWERVEFSEDGKFTARMIVSNRRVDGLNIIGMPYLARIMKPGITFHSTEPKLAHSHIIRALSGLREEMPKGDCFNYTLPPDSGLDSSFLLAGYSLSPNYTFQREASCKLDPLSVMTEKFRANIRKGQKRIGVEPNEDIERYMRLYVSFCKSRSLKEVIDYEAVRRVWEACRARKQAVILTAVNGAGEDIASSMLLWDDHHLYNWLNCRSLIFYDYAAISVLFLNAIELAIKMGLTFDSDGFSSLEQGIYTSRLGLLPKLRMDVSITNSKAELKTAFRDHTKALIGQKPKRTLLKLQSVLSDFRKPQTPTPKNDSEE